MQLQGNRLRGFSKPLFCRVQGRLAASSGLARIVLIGAFTVVLLGGCGDTALLRSSEELAAKAKGSGDRVEAFYNNLQKAHADMRNEEVRLQSEAATDLDPATPGPNNPLKSDDVKVRVKSARVLEVYCVQLSGLAHSKSANEMEEAIKEANSQLSGFGTKNFSVLDTLKSASTPVTSSLRILGRRAFAVWAGKWLKQNLAKSDSFVVRTGEVLRDETKLDSQEASKRAVRLQGLAERVYRKKVESKASKEEQNEYLEAARRYAQMSQAFKQDSPSSIYEDLLEIHRRLMKQVPDKLKE